MKLVLRVQFCWVQSACVVRYTGCFTKTSSISSPYISNATLYVATNQVSCVIGSLIFSKKYWFLFQQQVGTSSAS